MPEPDAPDTSTPAEVRTTEVTEHPIGMTFAGSQAQTLARLDATSFSLHRPEGGLLLSIDLSTGKLTKGEDYDASDAAEAFWHAVEAMAPDAPKYRKGERS